MNILDTIFEGDSLNVLDQLPDNEVQCAFADPPYNLQLNQTLERPNGTAYVGAKEAHWDKFDSYAAYDAFTREWLVKIKRVLNTNGTLWVMGSYHNIHRIGSIMQDLGFWIINEVQWVKVNPTPNFKGVRLTNAQETLIWAMKRPNAKYTFNYRLLKALNGGKQMRSDWHLPVCAGKERLRDENGVSIHKTQKPLSLLFRALLTSTRPGDLVIDPFSGTGTTITAAKILNRRYCGIEREPAYVPLIRNRVETTEQIIASDEELLTPEAQVVCKRKQSGKYLTAAEIASTFREKHDQ